MNADAWLAIAARQFAQVSILLIAVAFVSKLLCRNRPHAAYALWLLVLIKALTPPIWSSPVGIFSWMQFHRQPAMQIPSIATPPHSAAIAIHPVSSTSIAVSHAPLLIAPQPHHSLPIASILLAVWATGCLVTICISLIRWRIFRRKIESASASASAPPSASRIFQEIALHLQISRPPPLLACDPPIGPALAGLFRPAVVAPRDLLREKSLDELRTIFAHELIHLRRGDHLVAALQLAAQSIWWFYPPIGWMNHEMNHVRELCCDEEVIASLQCDPASYAQLLLDELRRGTFHATIFSQGVHPLQITRERLNHVTRAAMRFRRRSPRMYWVALAVLALALLPGAGISLRADATSSPPPPAAMDAAGSGGAGGSASPQQGATRMRHFVQLVVGVDRLTFQGQDITLAQLPKVLEQVPDRRHTVLCFGFATDQLTLRQFNQVHDHALQLSSQLGFEYFSDVGQKDLDTVGGPDQAVTSLSQIVNDAVHIISTCADGDPRIAKALATFKGLKDADVVAETAKYLADENANVRRAAIYVLWVGDFSSIDPAVAPLEKLCTNPEPETRGMAALALGARKIIDAEQSLIDMATQDKSGYSRRCAAYALGLLGDVGALPTLQEASRDRDPMVAANAKAAIQLLTTPTSTQQSGQ